MTHPSNCAALLRPIIVTVMISLSFTTGSNANAASVGAAIADGKAWSMKTPDGRDAQATFQPNGKGALRVGSRSLKLKWRESGNLFCMKLGFMKERCSEMHAVDGGFDSYIDGKKQSELRR